MARLLTAYHKNLLKYFSEGDVAVYTRLADDYQNA